MIGNNIKRIREEKGMGVNELAREAGMNASYLSAIERGEKKNPTTNTLEKLSKALGVSMEDFMQKEKSQYEIDELLEIADEELKKEMEEMKFKKITLIKEVLKEDISLDELKLALATIKAYKEANK